MCENYQKMAKKKSGNSKFKTLTGAFQKSGRPAGPIRMLEFCYLFCCEDPHGLKARPWLSLALE